MVLPSTPARPSIATPPRFLSSTCSVVSSPSALEQIESLVVDHPEFFVDEDMDNRLPMIEAAKHHIVTLFRIIDLLIPKDILAEIEKPFTADCVKCPLSKVSKLRLKQCNRSVRSGTDVNSVMSNGEQCLHNRVDLQRLLDKDKQLRKRLESVLKSEKKAKSCLESLLNQNNFDPGQKDTQKTKNNSRVQAEDLLKTRCVGFQGGSSTGEDGIWSKKSDFLYWDAETDRDAN
ncbi:hypothetical protein COL940_010807 [Colletotrichum noveboracense]|nr:hypothetical protein COL940_010807 [Colletotrichum noveboracense]